MMYKVIVIEDEIRICDLIVKLIDWDSLGLQLAGVAYDGVSACTLIDQTKPDIVLTDIRLPGMTGIDLIKKCYEEQQETCPKFIIISGHKEFEYAQSALKYGVVDFLIKPVNQLDLNNTLLKAVRKIDEIAARRRQLLEIDEKLDYYRTMHRTLMLKTVTENPDALKSLTAEEFSWRYGVEFKKAYVCSFIIRLFFEGDSSNNVEFFQSKIADSVLCTVFVDYAIAKFQNGLICHVNLEKHQFPEFKKNIALMKRQLDKLTYPYDFISYVIAVGEEALIAENGYIRTTSAAKYAADAAISLSDNPIFYKDLHHGVSLVHLLKDSTLEALLSDAVERLESALFEKYFEAFLKAASEVPYYALGLSEVSVKLLDHVMSALQKRYGAVYPVQKLREQIGKELLNCRTVPDLLQLLKKGMIEAAGEIEQSVRQLENPTITAVKRYVEDHFSEKVTLEVVADTVYLNPAYLAALFKKETGMTFLDYLTSVRVEKSKVLLCDIKLNLSQITRAVGYNDSKYFTKLFIKYTGIKPLEYRKLYINNLL